MLQQVPRAKGYIIDVQRFHAAVRLSLEDYCQGIKDPAQEELRTNLWRKMEQISGVRSARGLLYEANAVHTSPSNILLQPNSFGVD